MARREARGGHHLGRKRPEEPASGLVDFFRRRGTDEVEEFEVVQEDVRFMLPKEIRTVVKEREAQPAIG